MNTINFLILMMVEMAEDHIGHLVSLEEVMIGLTAQKGIEVLEIGGLGIKT